jgi:hypothetical protein
MTETAAKIYGVKVKFTLQLTVSQSVCLGVEPTLARVIRYTSCLKVAALSLWGCSLQCNNSMIRVMQNP